VSVSLRCGQLVQVLILIWNISSYTYITIVITSECIGLIYTQHPVDFVKNQRGFTTRSFVDADAIFGDSSNKQRRLGTYRTDFSTV